MPDSSNSPGNPPETAQASLLRLTRRHSLPASTTFSTFLSLWSAENANRENRERSNSSTANDVHPGIANNTSSNNRHHRSASISGDTLLNGSSNGNGALGGNRHRYGHRHTRSAVVDTPVIVKSYNPGPAVSRNASPLHENDDIEDIALPSIDSFSFDGILKAIDPAVTTALDSVGKLCEEYQTSLRTEVDALTDAQAEIDAMIKEADKLTSQAFKTTKMRTERLDAEAVGLKGGSTADALAAAAEATHTSLTSIITTLLAIDEMLPVQERLSPLSSAHKKHYPRLHTLLADKAHEIEVRFRNVRSPEMRPVSRPLSVQTLMSRLDLDLGESSSSRTTMDPSSSWSPRRRLSTSSTLLLSSPTVSRASTSYTHNRGISSPHLQLRTILPSPSNEQISASGSYFPIAPKTATGVSLTSPMYTAQQHLEGSISPRPMSPLMSPRRPSGMWSRRASSGTLAAFMARETDNSALYPSPSSGSDKDGGGTSPVGSNPTNSKPPSTWRHSAGSWAGFFGGRSSKGSSEVSKGVSAEERLKMLLQAASDGNSSSSSKKKGKGKGVQR